MADHEQPIGFLGSGNHPLAIRELQGHRFFAQYVLACFERLHRHICVQHRGQRNINHIDLRIAQQVFEIRVRRDARKIDLLARRTKVALNPSPITRQSLRVAFANRGDAHRQSVGTRANVSSR